MADDRYTRVTFRGKTVDKYTRAALLAVEKELGYELTIVQGSYNKGVGASAGTHDGGGCVDLARADWANKVRVLRKHGFAAWHRTTIPGVWSEHIHAVQVGNTKASTAAKNQVTAYRNHRNGLANNAADNTWRPSPIVAFIYPAGKPIQEQDMPITNAEITKIADAVWASRSIPLPGNYKSAAEMQATPEWTARAALQATWTHAWHANVNAIDADVLADAIVAKLGGSADAAAIKQAVKDALSEGTDDE